LTVTLYHINIGNLNLITLSFYKNNTTMYINLWYNKLNMLSAKVQVELTIYAIILTV
jgi:hypothetical protein